MTLASTWATTRKNFYGGDGGLAGDIVLTFPVAASTSLEKGDIIKLTSGYALKTNATTDNAIGIAIIDADNSSGAAGDIEVSVKVRGIAQVNARINHTGTYDDALVPFTKCGLSTDGTSTGQFVSCGADPTVFIGKMLSTEAKPSGAGVKRRALVYVDLLGVPDQA
jgi:hypothetical protein